LSLIKFTTGTSVTIVRLLWRLITVTFGQSILRLSWSEKWAAWWMWDNEPLAVQKNKPAPTPWKPVPIASVKGSVVSTHSATLTTNRQPRQLSVHTYCKVICGRTQNVRCLWNQAQTMAT
jgi:hypothetical protein